MFYKGFISLNLLFLVLNPHFSHSANILFLFGGGNLSHKLSIWPFVTALADKGHNVTFVSSSPVKPTNHTGVTDLAPKIFQDFTAQLYKANRFQDRFTGAKWDIIDPGYDEISIAFCQATFKAAHSDEEPEFREIIQNGMFDLVIINFAFNECAFYLTHRFGAKSILSSSTVVIPWFHGVYGIPMEISWIPDLMADFDHPMGFFGRMWNTYRYLKGYSRRESVGQKLAEMYKNAFALNSADVPEFSALERNTSLVFLNSHYSMEFARSLPPSFINIGGMSCWSPVGELPANFKEYMDAAEQGVILITFGSTVPLNTLSESFINIYFEAMRKFNKARFVWRWEGEMPANAPKNLMASKWLPQREILDHPKTIGFMTHGGLNSIIEATYHGVPLIVSPLFADQDYNAYRVRAHEVGLTLEFTTFSQENLDSALKELITNPKYKKNMEIRSKIFKDRPQSPIEDAVFWTEFVLRQDDTSALKPMLLEQPWYIRTSVDVLGFFVLLSVLVPILVAYIGKRLVQRWF